LAGLLLSAACGDAADDRQGAAEVDPEGPVSIRPRPPQPEPTPVSTSAPPERGGLPSDLEKLMSDPPEQVDAEQFDALLGYYCVSCHARPPSTAATDGFFFDDWPDLAVGGNYGRDNAERMLERVVDRMSNGSMPPEGALLTRLVPDAARQLMIDFLRDALRSTP
jgi:hypothetical protein